MRILIVFFQLVSCSFLFLLQREDLKRNVTTAQPWGCKSSCIPQCTAGPLGRVLHPGGIPTARGGCGIRHLRSLKGIILCQHSYRGACQNALQSILFGRQPWAPLSKRRNPRQNHNLIQPGELCLIVFMAQRPMFIHELGCRQHFIIYYC